MSRLIYLFADYEDLEDLEAIEHVTLRETLEDFATSVIDIDNRRVLEVTTEYDLWIKWCLTYPQWAVKFRMGS